MERQCRTCKKMVKRYYRRNDENTIVCESCFERLVILSRFSDITNIDKKYLRKFMLIDSGIWIKEGKFGIGRLV